MGSIKTIERKATRYEAIEVEQTYDEIRELFDDDPSCLVIKLLDKIEELEAELILANPKLAAKNAIEVVELRLENQQLKAWNKKIVDTVENCKL